MQLPLRKQKKKCYTAGCIFFSRCFNGNPFEAALRGLEQIQAER